MARVHALYTLAGLGALSLDQVEFALTDAHPRVREHAIRLAEPHLDRSDRVLRSVLAAVSDGQNRYSRKRAKPD